MYALPNKTQHKLIVKVRGGISQKLDNLTSASSSSSSFGQSNTASAKDDHGSISSVVRNNKKDFTSPLESSSTSSPFKSVPINFRESSLSKHIDEAGFDAELNNLPQPIFHSTNEKNGNKTKSQFNRAQKQYITPEHNEMIKFVQQTWKGVERDYKKSVNNYINIDLNNSSDHSGTSLSKQGKKKTATTSTPLLLSGSYHHTSRDTRDSSTSGGRQDSFQPFDLETFWGNRILKRLTEEI